jgi:hypothetical protein
MNVLFVIFLMIFGLVLFTTVRRLRSSNSIEAVPPGFTRSADFGGDSGDSGFDAALQSDGHACHHLGAGEPGSSHNAGSDAGHGFFDGGGFDGGGHH